MNREIKFRGKRVSNGEWVYGNFFFWTKRGKKIPIIGEGVQNGSCNGFEIIPETVGQFTGLKDKNGKEIYEGDIIRAWQWAIDEDFNPVIDETMHEICEVIWDNEISGWGLGSENMVVATDMLSHVSDTEVIGNIHETPELIKEEV